MEKPQRTGPLIYGYTVCLVAVITLLISITNLVNAVIDLGDPIHAGWSQPGTPSLASYENYKMDILKNAPKGEDAKGSAYIPDDPTLRAMFESAKSDKIANEVHDAKRSITLGSLLIVICTVLFITHWRWMRKLTANTTTHD